MSRTLSKISAPKQAIAKQEEVVSAGLPENTVILLGDKNSKLYKEMVKSAEKLGLTPLGEVFGPMRQLDSAVATALASKSR